MQSPELDDYIGAESYVDFVTDFNTLTAAAQNGDSGRRKRVVEKEKKEYPPPISPWMMKKYCTGDGRLIIEEVKSMQEMKRTWMELKNLIVKRIVNQEDGDVMKETEEDDQTVEKESVKCGGGTKCSEYSSMEANSCGFGVEVAAFNPVRS
ncbi:Uncharacterized protein Adt_39782 [Abeliophyllum distichum]|uniref:Uncharacterized protein n=1 Tax=Abeliophyllum distichum TaxID=126358 RepID=A0ABD1Q653_9LAMI